MRANIDPDLAWYVATFKPGMAAKASLSIHEAGFRVYLPRKRKDRWSKKHGVRIEYETPLMPPYLFVGFKPEARHFEFVRACNGVGHFLRSAEGTPLLIPPAIIEAILIAETNMEYDETDRARKARQETTERMFPPGTAVKLVDDLNGLLAQFEGTVIETNNRGERVKVDFGSFTGWIDGDKLDKVEAA